MPAVLTHKSIMLLARERVANIRDVLRVKVNTGATVTDLEHRLLHLARKAHELMSESTLGLPTIEPPSGPPYATPLGAGVSRFAVMGSMGPDIPAFAAALQNGQQWVFDLIHKGNPDPDRERVVARTTDLALEIWRQAKTRIDASALDAAKKAAARAAVQGYVLGHLCHVAGDVLSHPYINDIEWHVSTASRRKFTHGGGEAEIDAVVARQVLQRGSTREGQRWNVWWPELEEVPAALFDAYDAAVDRIHQARTNRPAGFGGFEERLKALDPPALSVDFLKDGYQLYRGGIVSIAYGWGYASWWAALTPLILPAIAMFPLVAAMPRGRKLLGADFREAGEREWFEVLMLPLATTALIPVVYGSWQTALTRFGVEALSWTGVSAALTTLAAGVTFFATLGVNDLPAWFRWGVLFAVPVAFGLFFLFKAIADAGHRKFAISLIHSLPLLAFLLFMFIVLLALLFSQGTDLTPIPYGFLAGLVVVGLLVAWFVLPKTARDASIPEDVKPFPADLATLVRLFDDGTLHHDAAVLAPTLADRFYPSGTRKLLKLWYEGDGKLQVRSRRLALEFSFDDEPVAPGQVVPSPITPMTAVEYADFLNRTVKDQNGVTGKLRAAVVHPNEIQHDLPPGATFADEADTADVDNDSLKGSEAVQRARLAERWTPLATSQEDADYFLHHAPKPQQAVRFGTRGPLPFDPRETGPVEGLGKVSSTGTDVIGDATRFGAFFVPGDRIRAAGQERVVTLVAPDQEKLVVDAAFVPPLDGAEYQRLATALELRDRFDYVTNPFTGVLGGDKIMDLAADLGALLCLGATAHLVDEGDLTVPALVGKQDPGGAAIDAKLGKVAQVFRNWSLDRRRVNEWRMLVTGGAVSEKGDAPDGYDAAMPAPRDPAWRNLVPEGEPVLRRLGFVPLLRGWLDAVGGRNANAVDPTVPAGDGTSNRDLSRALAHLFDMPDPVVVA